MTVVGRDTTSPAPASVVRQFGRLQLLRLVGKSERTMAWCVADPRSGQELLLVLPRLQSPDATALERCRQEVHQASRLDHPQLAPAVEVGIQDGWPFVTYDLGGCTTLADDPAGEGLSGSEAAALVTQVLAGLAFAHDAGIAHHDLQRYLLLVGEGGQLRLAGLAVAAELGAQTLGGSTPGMAAPSALRRQREAAERDVLATGVLLHGLLAGVSALGEADTGRVIARLPPQGREIVRLPWTTRHPVAEPLRAIVNRATERQPRQRYLSARTLLSALEGWLQTDGSAGGGPLALLSDRLRTAGVLPSNPHAAARAARLALMEHERTNELAEVVLQDLALSFEMLRMVNSAQVRGLQVSGGGPVLTVRRAIAMMGLDGVRHAALALREWPGPLNAAGAGELERLIDRCKRAGRLAMMLRPPGYDGEVVYLITLLQNLGQLVVHYHFADEAQQIHHLVQPAPALREGEAEEPGMSEEAAAYAVLGTDIEAMGIAVARHWGLDDAVLHMIRRQPKTTVVRSVDSDDEMLRTVASCANEAVDALAQPAARVNAALHRVVQRYGRVLELNLRDLQAALQGRPPEPVAHAAPAAPAGVPVVEDLAARAAGPHTTAAARRAPTRAGQ